MVVCLVYSYDTIGEMTVVSGECNTELLDEPDCVHIKMAATTAANQLKLEEMESARTMLLFVEGFTIAALARTMASNGKSNTMCPSATPSSPDWVVVG